jgi:hypothetical protein
MAYFFMAGSTRKNPCFTDHRRFTKRCISLFVATSIYLVEGQFHMSIKITFIIGQLSLDEFEQLKNGYSILSKMILTPDDFKLFRYKQGDTIQVETNDGLRLWCNIDHLEIVKSEERFILIFTLTAIL